MSPAEGCSMFFAEGLALLTSVTSTNGSAMLFTEGFSDMSPAESRSLLFTEDLSGKSLTDGLPQGGTLYRVVENYLSGLTHFLANRHPLSVVSLPQQVVGLLLEIIDGLSQLTVVDSVEPPLLTPE